MSFEIVTDSSCNLPAAFAKQYGLHVLHLSYMLDGEQYKSYLEGPSTNLPEFYAKLRAGKNVDTSLPNIAETEALLRSLINEGKDILYIGFSSGLSGTFQSTSMLMMSLKAEFPQRKLLAVDTLAASGGEGLLVRYATLMKEDGATIEETYQWLEEHKLNLCHWFTVDDLMHLYRGGRVSRGGALAGTVLNIKPVLHVDNEGHLIPVENVRGRKKALLALVKHMQDTVFDDVSDQIIHITHGDSEKDAQFVADKVRETFNPKEIHIGYVDTIIGSHSGPGTIALFFLGQPR